MAASLSLPSSSPSIARPTPHSDGSLAMSRYRSSVEFQLSSAPSQGTAVALYNAATIAIPRQAPSGGVGLGTSSTHEGKNTLKSLLDFARCNNERERATFNLEAFLTRVHDERAEAEAALDVQIATSARRFAQSLVNTGPKASSQALDIGCGDYAASAPDQQSSETMPAIFIELQESQREGGRPDTPLTPSPQKRVVAFQIRERLKTLQKAEDIHQNVQKIRKEIQQAYQPFAGTVKRTGEAFRMELVLRPLITTSISNQLQQAIIRRTLRPKLELIRDINLGVWSFKATGGLTDIIQRELKDVATSTKTLNLYSVEVLLEPWAVKAAMPQNSPMPQGPLRQRKCHDNEAQRSHTDHGMKRLFADATTQTLSDPVETFAKGDAQKELPTLSSETSVRTARQSSHQIPKLVHADENPENIQPSLLMLASESEPQDRTVSYAANMPNTREQKLGEDVYNAPEEKEEASKVPVKETVTRLIAREKERQAINGSDAFLSLLDLVKKK